MRVKFVRSKPDHTSEVIKESKSDYLVIPNMCGTIRIDSKKYMVMAIEYDYDLGVITVKVY